MSGFKGTLRMGKPVSPGTKADDVTLSGEKKGEPSWLEESRKLIPGEALAGYLALQPLTRAAENAENVRIVLALVFCAVTVVLRWVGTQDPRASNPRQTVQVGAVVISTFSYIFLVYATGGQMFWHARVTDQELYAQILAAALGILGPAIHRGAFSK